MTYFNEDFAITCKPPMTGKSIKEPKVGDEILFESKGPIIEYWIYNSDFEPVLKMINSQPVYRVVHKYYDKSQRVCWQGIWPVFCPQIIYNHSTDELSRKDGNWSLEKYWQTKLYGDSEDKWERCKYPLNHK